MLEVSSGPEFYFEATWAYARLEDHLAVLVAMVKSDALLRLLQVVRVKRVRQALEAPAYLVSSLL